MSGRKWFLCPAVLLMLLGSLAGMPGVSFGQGQVEEEGVLVRVNGDVEVGADEREGVVVIVEGDALISGSVEVVVVVEGTATLTGARVTEIVVVEGAAVLQEGTVVAGDIQLVNAELISAEDAVVHGEVRYGTGFGFARGLLIFGLFVGLGVAVAVLLSGLVLAAVAPRSVRAAGASLTDEFGKTLLAMLFVWIGLPLLALIAFATVIGIPTGLGIFIFLLPALGFLGYLVVGIRIGDYVLAAARGSDEAWHPYLAALVGLALLLVAGWIPVLGSIVSPVAALLGSGALALNAWRMIRWPRVQAAAPAEA